MKRFLAITLSMLLAAAVFTCCSQPSSVNTSPTEAKINIVCTVFPQYDWVHEILGEKAEGFEITLLINNRVDLHNYQPSVDDIVKISTCDLFIYVGGESDDWVGNVLRQAANDDMAVINLLEALGGGAKIEEIIEGMEEEFDEDSQGDGDISGASDEEEQKAEFDEHVWLSLRNTVLFCSAITDSICGLDVANASDYIENLNIYIQKLMDLDSQYKAAVEAAPVKTLLFADRFPFRYLVDDYGIDYLAAFPGCSAETEASFATIILLAKRVDELGLNTVMVTESSDKKIAETIIRESTNKNQQILVMDAIQSVTSVDVQNGTTYLSLMEKNLDVLKNALK
ncbi:MAG: metal ABC transporter substrate-binding protein [Eubacteriaceae bacterium]|nr:metal ABC transporter substrate-binding protein [Eubacteriaceae bacterium]